MNNIICRKSLFLRQSYRLSVCLKRGRNPRNCKNCPPYFAWKKIHRSAHAIVFIYWHINMLYIPLVSLTPPISFPFFLLCTIYLYMHVCMNIWYLIKNNSYEEEIYTKMYKKQNIIYNSENKKTIYNIHTDRHGPRKSQIKGKMVKIRIIFKGECYTFPWVMKRHNG